uniref:Reverse transcriptase n=2 Tax=Oryza sativa subsp. japonica TaxID=39947 RepID=Q10GN8_ORYSJ|nr:putative reverse transcriptase [Oryza sativa Japonica Group]ABF97663.1 retrotransposon protein, putative, LINE subclass [Oryza sativa Japonica Group]
MVRKLPDIDNTQQSIKTLLKVKQTVFEEKYLGLPTPSGRIKSGKFQSLKEKFEKRLSDWCEKNLSMGRKEVLIKSVLQALPMYMMSVSKIPVSLCEEYMQLIRKFWWGEDRHKRKVHWISWHQLVKPKSQGGISFRYLKLFNQALLARQAWRLIQYPDSLCAKVLKAKYYPNGIIWRIGSESKIIIWRDNWIPREHNLKVLGKRSRARLKWVADLMLPNKQEWDERLIRQLFYPADADIILNIQLSHRMTEDFIAWHYDRVGMFTVRSAYKLALDIQTRSQGNVVGCSSAADGRKVWSDLWSTQAKALRSEMRKIWQLPPEQAFEKTGPDWLLMLLQQADPSIRAAALLLLWRAWFLRNDIIHGNGKAQTSASVMFLQHYAETLFMVRQKEVDLKGKGICQPNMHVRPSVPDSRTVWKPPPPGWVKLNVDGAFSA